MIYIEKNLVITGGKLVGDNCNLHYIYKSTLHVNNLSQHISSHKNYIAV